MEMTVEIHALGASIEMFVSNNDRRHLLVWPLMRPLSQYIQDALDAGVVIQACSSALRDRSLMPQDLIAECGQVIGMVSMLERATAPDTTVLTY